MTLRERRLAILRWLSLLTVLGLSALLFAFREKLEGMTAYGYPGIFLFALLSNASILLPMPGLAVVFSMGGVFPPLGVAIAAGTGGALGELSGYMAGFSGQAVVERIDVYERIAPWIQKYGVLAIVFLSAIPNPFFDLAGIAAGAMKMPLHHFLLACWIGQLTKALTFAYAGSASLQWLG
jgi:uncharacterized membrane protein YdjX (TVP38/TMEM64 family)